MTKVSEVQDVHKQLTGMALALVEEKGHDYSSYAAAKKEEERADADTFANIRLAHHLGLVDSPQASVLVRMADKFSRLISLRNPAEAPMVKSEKVKDTVVDMINYAIYFYILYEEARQQLMVSDYYKNVTFTVRKEMAGEGHGRDLEVK